MHLRHPGVSDGDSSSCFVINRFLSPSPVFSNALRLPRLAGHVSYQEARTRKPLLTLNPPAQEGVSPRVPRQGVSPLASPLLYPNSSHERIVHLPTEIFPLSSFVENSSGSISIAGNIVRIV